MSEQECTCGEFAGTSVRYADCPVHCPASAPLETDLATWLLEQIATTKRVTEYGCPGSGEYRGCDTLSDWADLAVDAMRAIVELHSGSEFGRTNKHLCQDSMVTAEECDTVRALARPYADRPGFREEWR